MLKRLLLLLLIMSLGVVEILMGWRMMVVFAILLWSVGCIAYGVWDLVGGGDDDGSESR